MCFLESAELNFRLRALVLPLPWQIKIQLKQKSYSMITIKNLSKYYTINRKKVSALSHINLDIKTNEIFAIIGSSGAGKSTLLRCMNLLEKPSQGEIIVDGVELTTLSPDALRAERKKIAMIFQHFNLVNNKTVFDNVALPLKLSGTLKGNEKKVHEFLTLVDLTDKAHAYPNQLSGGQKQRVAIARALISNPDLLLCDEATSALDPQTTKEILALLKKINQTLKLTIVLITHEMEVVRQICDRFALIEKGKIKQVESLDIFFNHPPKEHILLEGLKPSLPSYIIENMVQKPQPTYFPLCQIMFYGETSQKAIISQISKTHDIDLIILQANIDTIGQNTFGILILQMKGDEDKVGSAMNAFRNYKLHLEVLGYVK